MKTLVIGMICLAAVTAPVAHADPPISGEGIPPDDLGWTSCTFLSYGLNPPTVKFRPECLPP